MAQNTFGPSMRIRSLVTLACTMLAGQVPAIAAPDHDRPGMLTGNYSIGATNLTDPAPEDKKDVLLRIYLTGKAARDVFIALNAKQVRDQCFDDGTMMKTLGEIMCAKHPKGSHECWIGIDLKNQRLAAGFVC